LRPFVFFFLMLCCGLGSLASATEADDSAYRNALKLLSEGSFEEAKKAIEAVIAAQPEHAGAYLDLAILQCGMGRVDEAEALFGQIEARFDPPLAIRDLIRKIRAGECRPEGSGGGSRVQFRLGRGYDSNANQGARDPYFALVTDGGVIPLVLAPEFRPRSDSFTQLGLEAAYTRPDSGTLLHAYFNARKNDRISDYDLATTVIGMEAPWRAGKWESRWGGSLGATWLGGALYQKLANAYVQVLPPWPDLPAGWRVSVLGDWSRLWHPTLYRFDANILRAQALLTFQGRETQFLGNLGLTRDDGESGRTGGDRRGWTSNLIVRQRLAERFLGEFSWSHQYWRGDHAYLPGLFDEKREQRVTLWRLGASYAVAPRQSVMLEYRFLDNKENISLLGYRSRQIMLNWQYDFSR